MRRRSTAPRTLRGGLGALTIAGAALAAGCTHNHYYGVAGPPSYIVPGETIIYDDGYAEYCDVPGGVIRDGAAIVSDAANAGGRIVSGAASAVRELPRSRAVIGGPSYGRSTRIAADGGWRASSRGAEAPRVLVEGEAGTAIR